MRMKEIAFVSLFGVLAAAGLYKLFERAPTSRQRPPVATPSAANDSADRAQLQQLQLQMAGLQQQLTQQRLLAAGQQAGATPSAAASDAAPPPPDAAAEHQRQQENLDRIAANFEAEPRDASWSRDTTAAVQAELNQGELLKNALQSLECRSSLCRLEMVDDRSPAFFTQLNRMALKVANRLPSMAGQRLTRPDGKAVFVYYFSKDA